MNYLIDTCIYIWIITNNQKRISTKAKEALLSDNSTSYISIISQIEMTVKHTKRKIPGLSSPIMNYFKETRVNSGIEFLNLDCEDIENLSQLPKIHSDPFDRLLISQAIKHDMTIITSDEKFLEYPVKVIL